jgi:3-oxoacyl-[acyl-carrier-protein] synthase-1
MSELQISAYTVTTALGHGCEPNRQALARVDGGLRPCDLTGVDLQTWIGRVAGLEDAPLPDAYADHECRNNRLAHLGLLQDDFTDRVAEAIERYGSDRIGVFLGTSTSGIQTSEEAYANRDPVSGALPRDFRYETTHATYSLAGFVKAVLGLRGPSQVISTACSSSAKVFATAQRYIDAGLCDAALVGGVDSLCQMTLYGFNSLQLVSAEPCRPADEDRDGINIGEAAGFALLERGTADSAIALLGYGESSDAHHMSTPHPEGQGAALAIRHALERAGLQPQQIDYINLHGTATQANDLSEDRAVHGIFGNSVPCSSTKGFTGHTLGAAGIVEAIYSCFAIETGVVFPSLNTKRLDERMQSAIALEPLVRPVNRVVSNSFGFGGSNACLVLGRSS